MFCNFFFRIPGFLKKDRVFFKKDTHSNNNDDPKTQNMIRGINFKTRTGAASTDHLMG
jgi:hypothetical protein